MMRKKDAATFYEKVAIVDAGAEGKAVARVDDLVIFVPYAAPGDIADLKIVRWKKSYREAKAVHFHFYSGMRADPFCSHFASAVVAHGSTWLMSISCFISRNRSSTISPGLVNWTFLTSHRLSPHMRHNTTATSWSTHFRANDGLPART
jgi:predicted RNA-binding protein with TRAM domain